MKPIVKLLIAVPMSIFVCCISVFASFSNDCTALRDSVIRLHILANSDSEADQADKLAVRDGLLEVFEETFAECTDIASAKARAEQQLGTFADTAAEILASRGVRQTVTAEMTEEFFSATDYGDRIMPPGNYTAVRIRIGSAQGKNWFCVAFPPLCVGAASHAQTDAELAVSRQNGSWYVTRKNGGCTVKFKLIEWLEKLKAATGKD